VFNRIKRELNKNSFKRASRGVIKTPSLELASTENAKAVIVSQIYSSALHMTLLAIKSFVTHLDVPVRVELIDDGSLTQNDYNIINEHLCPVTITHIKSVNNKGLPDGGTWERLAHIIHLSQTEYVVQVDTDTLTINSLEEVKTCININQSFLISGPKWTKSIEAKQMAKIARDWNNNHIQSTAESFFDRVESIPLKSYCRGCSAFTGFAKGSFDYEDLKRFSDEMISFVGEKRWNEWGTEQLSSNVMVSLSPEPLILPWPKYQNFGFPFLKNLADTECSSLIHFIGSQRFEHNTYTKLAKVAIKSMQTR
jgi:hypothetical protein